MTLFPLSCTVAASYAGLGTTSASVGGRYNGGGETSSVLSRSGGGGTGMRVDKLERQHPARTHKAMPTMPTKTPMMMTTTYVVWNWSFATSSGLLLRLWRGKRDGMMQKEDRRECSSRA